MARITIYLVTQNKHKYLEAKSILREAGIELRMLDQKKEEIQSPDVEEIALHAARKAHKNTGLPVIVDDTALYIQSLNGFPGPFASYVYKTIGLKGILKLLEDKEDRRACFKTSIALVSKNMEITFNGETCGIITRSPLGDKGFGYDPIFMPEGATKTYAQMSIEEKNKYSHRSKALRKMIAWLKNHDNV